MSGVSHPDVPVTQSNRNIILSKKRSLTTLRQNVEKCCILLHFRLQKNRRVGEAPCSLFRVWVVRSLLPMVERAWNENEPERDSW